MAARRKVAATFAALVLTGAVLSALLVSAPASPQTPAAGSSIPLLSATGCTDGTFVDTTANPPVKGDNNDLIEDCLALVAIQNHWATNPANNSLSSWHPLRTWGTGTTVKINTWDQVAVERYQASDPNRVSIVSLGNPSAYVFRDVYPGAVRADRRISGSIPAQFGHLTFLHVLDLSGLNLTGSIPSTFTNFPYMTQLYLAGNQLTGTIPSTLGNLTNLRTLNLGFNQLSGTIPPELGQLTSLVILDLRNNRLTGNIPSELGNLAPPVGGLGYFHFCSNYLTGAVPDNLIGIVSRSYYPSLGSARFDPVACQLSATTTDATDTPTGDIPSDGTDTPAEDGDSPTDGTGAPGEDGETPSSTTTTTTTTTTTPEETDTGPVWNVLTLQRGGITAAQIRQTLDISLSDAIYIWNHFTQTWTRSTSSTALSTGAILSFRTKQTPDPELLTKLNLAEGTSEATLSTGWNIVNLPVPIQRGSTRPDGTVDETPQTAFLLDSQLINCDNNPAIFAVANWNFLNRVWTLWLPCDPATQTFITTAENAVYQDLNHINPADTTYFYARRALSITWNPQTQTFQPTLS